LDFEPLQYQHVANNNDLDDIWHNLYE